MADLEPVPLPDQTMHVKLLEQQVRRQREALEGMLGGLHTAYEDYVRAYRAVYQVDPDPSEVPSCAPS